MQKNISKGFLWLLFYTPNFQIQAVERLKICPWSRSVLAPTLSRVAFCSGSKSHGVLYLVYISVLSGRIVMCLNENILHRLMSLNVQSPVGTTVWEGLAGMVLLEGVCHWG